MELDESHCLSLYVFFFSFVFVCFFYYWVFFFLFSFKEFRYLYLVLQRNCSSFFSPTLIEVTTHIVIWIYILLKKYTQRTVGLCISHHHICIYAVFVLLLMCHPLWVHCVYSCIIIFFSFPQKTQVLIPLTYGWILSFRNLWSTNWFEKHFQLSLKPPLFCFHPWKRVCLRYWSPGCYSLPYRLHNATLECLLILPWKLPSSLWILQRFPLSQQIGKPSVINTF